MQPDLTPTQAADADDARPAESEESASASESAPSQEDAFMNAVIRGQTDTLASTSNQDDAGDEAESADAADGEPAQSRDAKPTDQQPGRRARRAEEAAAERKRLSDENEALKARIAELVPTPPDATEETRKAILAAEERFRRLSLKSLDDQDWADGDFDWLEGEKKRRAVAPELRQHYDTVLEADRAALTESFKAAENRFLNGQAQQIRRLSAKPGIDTAAFIAEGSYEIQGEMLYAAGAATRDAENRALRDEIGDLKRQLLGQVRPPMNGGRSSPGRTYDEDSVMNALIRGGRA